MYTVIGGFDFTNSIPHDTINFDDKVNDPQGQSTFDILDSSNAPISTPGQLVTIVDVPRIFGGVIPYPAGGASVQTLVPAPTTPTIGMEVIIFDETIAPEPQLGGGVVVGSSVPASNFLGKAAYFPDTTYWVLSGTISGTITRGTPQFYNVTQTFANNAVGTGFITQTTFAGYIQPGQSYMFSVYVQVTSALTNASGIFKMDFLDQNNNVLATQSSTFTTTSGQQRLSVQGVAPANTAFIKVSMGGQTTSTTNSGTIVYGTPQLEPMWFTAEGISYPTDDCNYNQANCFRMPDDTISRSRIFAGYIEDLQISYEGKTRTYHASIAPAEKVLDNTNLITANYNTTADSTIINNIVANNYPNLLSGNNIAANSSAPNSIQTGLTVDAISYTDLSFREILNSQIDQSGFSYYVSPYYQVYYNALFYNICPFSFSDTPDNVSSFPYYDYLLEYDGTQIKERLKVIGANPTGPSITDNYTGGGAGPFGLSHIPLNISSVTTANGANIILTGIKGVNTFAQGYGALVDPVNKLLTFSANTPAGTVAISYTWQNPVVNTVQKLDGISATINAPGYVTPTFDSKINDSNVTSLASGNIRGLAELTRWGLPVTVITCKSPKYIQPGFAVYFTSSLDGIINKPFVVMETKGKVLGGGINEYAYTLGVYVPNIIDHVRNHHKTLNRSVSVGAVTTSLQTDIATTESIAYSERITHTP